MNFDSLDVDWSYLLERLEAVVDLGEEYLTRKLAEFQFDPELFATLPAFRWQQENQNGYLNPIIHSDLPNHRDLVGLDFLLQRLRQNTKQFLLGAPANHVLLTGSRGSGKSSAIRGLLTEFGESGLRLIEVRGKDLHQLPAIAALLRPQPYFFILFCDDFSPAVVNKSPELMSLLDGGLEILPENILIYATCASSAGEEQIPFPDLVKNNGLIDRFGLVLECPPITQETYLSIVRQLAARYELTIAPDSLDQEALQWGTLRASHSGRVARQFINDLVGRLKLAGSSNSMENHKSTTN